MLDDLVFIEVIRQNPADDGPRLIYADFLEEKGDDLSIARAEFIRLQCLIAREYRTPDGITAALRSQELKLQLYWRVWFRSLCQALGEPLPMGPAPVQVKKKNFEETARYEKYFLKRINDTGPWPHVIEQYWGNGRDVPYFHSGQFRRGFVSHLAIAAKSYRTAQHINRLLERTPLEGLAIVGMTPTQFMEILNQTDLSRIRTLELIFVDSLVVELAVRSEQFRQLERLIIRHTQGNNDIAATLATATTLDSLKHLHVRACPFTLRGMAELVWAPFMHQLETFAVPECTGIDDRLLRLLVDHQPPLHFHHLDITHARCYMDTFQLLSTSVATDITTTNSETNWPELYQYV